MARTTSAAVALIIEVDSSISLSPFIEAATALVTKHCEDANDDYTAAELELIERWLSAHLYTVRDMRAFHEKADEITEVKQSSVGKGLDSSHYGQTAMLLDWYGGLSALNQAIKAGKRTSVSVEWAGTPEDEAVADPTETQY